MAVYTMIEDRFFTFKDLIRERYLRQAPTMMKVLSR